MDKYLLVVLILLVAGMGIMAIQDRWLEFYMMLGGAIIVIIYSSMKNRKEIQKERRKRRFKK